MTTASAGTETRIQLPQLLTHTRMACANTCLRRHYYAYELCLRPEDKGSPLRIGGAYHDALEASDVNNDDTSGFDVIYENYATKPQYIDRFEWELEREKTLRLFAGHQWRWSTERFRVIATEQEFVLPLVHPETGEVHDHFKLAGKIDRIIELVDGRLAVQEYKTAGETITPEADYWKRLRIDSQISLYMLAAIQLGYDVQTVVYDVTRKPTIKPRKLTKAEQKQGGPERETVAMYGERLNRDFVERPDYYFQRREIPRLRSDLDEFRSELWHIAELLHDCRIYGRWFRNTGACRFPYPCKYLDICVNNVQPEVDGVPDGWTITDTPHPELETIK